MRLFAQDDDAQPYAAADNLSEEYVADPTNEGNVEYRMVRTQFNHLLHI